MIDNGDLKIEFFHYTLDHNFWTPPTLWTQQALPINHRVHTPQFYLVKSWYLGTVFEQFWGTYPKQIFFGNLSKSKNPKTPVFRGFGSWITEKRQGIGFWFAWQSIGREKTVRLEPLTLFWGQFEIFRKIGGGPKITIKGVAGVV